MGLVWWQYSETMQNTQICCKSNADINLEENSTFFLRSFALISKNVILLEIIIKITKNNAKSSAYFFMSRRLIVIFCFYFLFYTCNHLVVEENLASM